VAQALRHDPGCAPKQARHRGHFYQRPVTGNRGGNIDKVELFAGEQGCGIRIARRDRKTRGGVNQAPAL